MVSRILISIALLCSSVAFSQDENGLTFSQVMIVDISSEVVVPEGKVWKVVAMIHSGGTGTSVSDYRRILLNGGEAYLGSLVTEYAHSLPLWLPEGTTIQAADHYGDYYMTELNIIEFNID